MNNNEINEISRNDIPSNDSNKLNEENETSESITNSLDCLFENDFDCGTFEKLWTNDQFILNFYIL